MKKKLSVLSVAALSVICYNSFNAQELDKFKADLGKKTVMGKELRVPYTDVITYYGYVKPGSKPDEEKVEKNTIICMYGFLW